MKKGAKTVVKSVIFMLATVALLYFLFSLSTVAAETSGSSDDAELIIADQTDSGPRFSNNNFTFTANFSNNTNSPINQTYGNCNITFDFNGTQTKVDRMAYNFTSEIWDFNRSFEYRGTHQFYVNCTSIFGNITLNESFEIGNTAPTVSKGGGNTFIDTDNNDFTDDYWVCTEDTLCLYNFTANVTDPDVNDVLTYANLSANTTLTNFTFNLTSGILEINASEDSLNGLRQIRLQASDGIGQDDGILRLNISSVNDAPTWDNLDNQSFNESSLFLYVLNTTDEENDNPFKFNITFLNCTVAQWSTRDCDTYAGKELFNSSQYSINETTGQLTINFTPLRNDVGDYVINFTVEDTNNNNTPYNASTTRVANFTVLEINAIPYFSYVCDNEVNGTEDGEFTCRINATDINEVQNLTFTSNYSWFLFNDTNLNVTQMNVNSTTNFNASVLVNFTAGDAEVGNWSINITVSDTGVPVGKNTTTMYVYIYNVNDSVTIEDIANVTQYTSNGEQTILLNATDNDLLISDENEYNEILTFNTNDSNVAISFEEIAGTNKTRATLTYNPSTMDPGNHTINISVHDANNFSIAFDLFTIQILSNNGPVWNASVQTNWTLYEDNLTYIDLSLNISDADGDAINFSWTNDTPFQSFGINISTGVINFTAIDEDVGQHLVNVTATDGATEVYLLFNFTVLNVNDDPFIDRPISSSGDITVDATTSHMNTTEDSTATVVLYVDDDDFKILAGQKGFGDENITLNVTIVGPNTTLLNFIRQGGLPNDANPNRTQFNAAFTAGKPDVGEYNITINATDTFNVSNVITINLSIVELQHAPTMTEIGNLTFSILDTIYLDVNTTDPEDINESDPNSNLTYSIVNLTQNGNFLTINKTTGVINYSFNASQGGIWNFNISVNDSLNKYDWEIINITVYDYPVFITPDSGFTFNLKENGTEVLNFSVNHTVQNNLTFSLVIDGFVFNTTSGPGNATDFLWNFTANFTHETTCSGVVNLSLNVSNEKLSNITYWNLTVNHTNFPLIFIANISDQSAASSSTLTLSNYFLDIDAGAGSCTNQTIGFNYTLLNATGEEITVEIVNWTNVDPSATFSAEGTGGANYTITGIEYNSSNYSLPINSTVKSNNFTIQLSASNSTTTTTTPTPSGGGGGGDDDTKIVSLKLLVPDPVSALKQDKLIIPIGVWNDGTKDLREIILDASVAKDGILRTDLIATFDNSFIPFLGQGDRVDVTMIVDIDTKATGIFEVTINATVKDPEYTDWAKMYIEIREDEDILERIVFTEEFIVGNPECAELFELVNQAKNLYISGDFTAATRKADDALDACKRAIAQPARLRDRDIFEQNLLTTITIASLVAFGLGFAYYYYRRVKLKRELIGYQGKI